MARYVVLSFDDNEEAERFVDDVRAYNQGKVEGLFAKPTMFCPNSGAGGCKGKGSGRRVSNYTWGLKYGWWVCAGCRKPSGAMSDEKRMRSVVSQGKNLLSEAQDRVSVFDKEQF